MGPYDFLGRGLKFPLQVDKQTGYIATVSYEDDIREAIGIILNTYIGERIMRPDFGGNVADYIFNAVNRRTFEDITVGLSEMLELQEPRIENVEVETGFADAANGGALNINVGYTVRTTNNRFNHVYPFYMDEGNQEESII